MTMGRGLLGKQVRMQQGSDKRETFAGVVQGMAEKGPEVSQELREKLGGDPGPGHMIDAVLQLCATMQKAAISGDLERGMDAVSGSLYLLRELAIAQGYIVPEEKIQA